MDIFSTVAGAAALLIALRGAVDSFNWIEQVLRQNIGTPVVADRLHHFESLRQALDEWREEFHVKEIRFVDRPPELDERCLLKYLPTDDHKFVLDKVELIQNRLESVKSRLKEHIREKSPSFIYWNSGSGAKSKRWAKWISKNREMIDDTLHWIRIHEEDLRDASKKIAPLKREEWEAAIQNLISIDERNYHNKALDRRQEGTCQWIFERLEYKNWMSEMGSNLLWVNATRELLHRHSTSSLIFVNSR